MKVKLNLNEKRLELIPETQFETSFIWETLGGMGGLVCKLASSTSPMLIIKGEDD